jgi:hypothetical protein
MNQSLSKKWWRISTAALILAVGVSTGVWGVTAHAAAMAPVHIHSGSLSVLEIDKQVLPETSITGPAFSSLSDYAPSSQTYPPNSYPATAIAWTGTDQGHSLNVETSKDGLTYQNQVVLNEKSNVRPAVLLFNNHTIGTLAPNLVVLAWTGTDPNHLLNVMFDVYGARQMITLNENSLYSPALAYFNGQIWLAWTGTDPNHLLNVMAMGPDGLHPGQKTILRGGLFSSRSGPSLREDMSGNLLLLTWTTLASPGSIYLAQSSNGVTWTTSFSPPPPQTSASRPDVLARPGAVPAGLPTDYWAWTGTDTANSLNIAFTSTLDSWPAPIVTLDERALGGPALGYSTKLGLGAPNTVTLLLVWTGVDSAHHLNVAVLQVG